MSELWVAVATGAFALAGSAITAAASARASQRSIVELRAAVKDEALPSPVRAEAGVALMHCIHRVDSTLSWFITFFGVFFIVFGALIFFSPNPPGTSAALIVLFEIFGGVTLVAGVFALLWGLWMGRLWDSKKMQKQVARVRKELDPLSADDAKVGHEAGSSASTGTESPDPASDGEDSTTGSPGPRE